MKKILFILTIFTTAISHGADNSREDFATKMQNFLNKMTTFSRTRQGVPLSGIFLNDYNSIKYTANRMYNKLAPTLQDNPEFINAGTKINKNIETKEDLNNFKGAVQTIVMTFFNNSKGPAQEAAPDQPTYSFDITLSGSALDNAGRIQSVEEEKKKASDIEKSTEKEK